MKIKYHLQDMAITSNPNDKMGRVEQRDTLDEVAILDEMIKRGTDLSRQAMLGVIDLYTAVVSDRVQQGHAVSTRLANFRPSIKGLFDGSTDVFDPERHSFRASISEGVEMKRKMREATGERQIASIPVPALIEFYDHGSSTVNKKLTVGNIGELRGEELKFNPANSVEGIFLIKDDDGVETRVETVSVLTDSRLMFLIPVTLTAGKHSVEVRRSYTSPRKTRNGRLSKTLTVTVNA